MANRQSVSISLHLDSGLKYAALGALLLGLAISAANADEVPSATTGAADTTVGTNDPLESVNRFTSDFNRALRGAVIDPLVDGYQYVTPEPYSSRLPISSRT